MTQTTKAKNLEVKTNNPLLRSKFRKSMINVMDAAANGLLVNHYRANRYGLINASIRDPKGYWTANATGEVKTLIRQGLIYNPRERWEACEGYVTHWRMRPTALGVEMLAAAKRVIEREAQK